ncbi:MAG: acylphosphatase [Aestuariivirgaceae bacterium]
MAKKAVKVIIRGRVQGVGYRDWIERQARPAGLAGYVRNRRDGSVELVISGSDSQIAAMLEQCRQGPRLAAVEDLEVLADEWAGEGFSILPTA